MPQVREGDEDVTHSQEVQRVLTFNPGDVLNIERGTHAGWSVRRSTHPSVMGDTAFFNDAKDMLAYLSRVLN